MTIPIVTLAEIVNEVNPDQEKAPLPNWIMLAFRVVCASIMDDDNTNTSNTSRNSN